MVQNCEGFDREQPKRRRCNDSTLQVAPQMHSDTESLVWELKAKYEQSRISNEIYIDPQGYEKELGITKTHDDTSLDAPDRTSSRPLVEIAQEFLGGKKTVLLIMGDPGSGKSAFARKLESILWHTYSEPSDPNVRIPLLINLPSVSKTAPDLMGEVLNHKGFSRQQILNLKRSNRQFILICDGYDEAQTTSNIYNSNRFNQPGQWCVKLIIFCRSDKIGRDSDGRFQPEQPDRYNSVKLDLFQKAATAPFTFSQIKEYVHEYVLQQHRQHSVHMQHMQQDWQHSGGYQIAQQQLLLEAQEAQETQLSAEVIREWDEQRYMKMLTDIPNLMELVRNPYILSFVLHLLPEFAGSMQGASRSRVSFDALYKHIFDDWMGVGKKRLISKAMTEKEQTAFVELLDSGFADTLIGTLKELAVEIYTRQAGDPVVQYSHLRDKDKEQDKWKIKFFGPDPEARLFQESVPLVRSGPYFRFTHQSLLQYLYSLAVVDPHSSGDIDSEIPKRSTPESLWMSSSGALSQCGQAQPNEQTEAQQAKALVKDHKLSVTNIAKRSMAVQFLADRVRDNPVFMKQLVETVRESRNITDGDDQTLAANAMTILVRSGMRFNSADLQGIKIRGANLTGGEFDSADLRNADLRDTILNKCWLRGARLDGAKLDAAEFGELPYVDLSTIKFISPELASEVSVASDVSNESPATPPNLSSVTPTASAYTSDGKRYAVGFTNGFITIFDAFQWTITHSFQGSKKSITAIAFSPKQERLAYGDMMGNIKIRENTGNFTADTLSFQAHGDYISDLIFSSDGRRIATSSQDNKVGLWDAMSGIPLWPERKIKRHKGASSVAFSPDGTLLASSGSDKVIKLWDAASGKCKSEFSGHDGPISKVLFSPKGHQVVSASSDKTVRVWSVSNGNCEHTLLDHSERVTSIAYSPDGQQLVSCSEDSTIRTWDPRSGGAGPIYRGHKDCVMSIAYSPGGDQIASCSRDKTLRVWECQNATKGAVIFGRTNTDSSGWYPYSTIKGRDNSDENKTFQPTLQNPRALTKSTSFPGKGRVMRSPDELLTATLSADSLSIQLYIRGASEPGDPLAGHSKKIICFVFSPDSRCIASGSLDKDIRVWDTQSGNAICTLKGHTSAVTSVAYSSKGDRIVSSSKDGTVRLWDSSIQQASDIDAAVGGTLAGGAPINRCLLTFRCEGYSWPMQTVAISSCGHWVAAGGEDPVVRLWDAVNYTGKPHATFTGFDSAWNCIVFSPDSIHLASASDDGTVWIWDIRTGEKKHTFIHGGSSVKCLAYLSLGKFLASGGKSCKIWDVETGDLEAELKHNRSVVSIASPDDEELWLGTEDQTVHVWSYAGHSQGTALVSTTVFSGDFQHVASSLGGHLVYLWSTESGKRDSILEGHSRSIECISCSPVSNLLVTGCSDGTVGVWNSETGKSWGMLKAHSGVITGVTFSPNGSQFATVSMDETFRLWNVVAHENRVSVESQGFPISDEEKDVLSPGADGATLQGRAQGNIPQANDQGNPPPAEGQGEFQYVGEQGPQAQIDQQESAMQMDDQDLAMLADEGLEKYGTQLDRPELVTFYRDRSGLEHTPVYSPDGTDIAVINSQGTVLRFDARTGEPLPSLICDKEHSKTTCVAYIPCGGRIATSSDTGTARVWNPISGIAILELKGHTASVTSITFSPFCHQIATSSADGTARLWNVEVDDGQDSVGLPLIGHKGPVLCVAYSPDGKFLASGSADRTVRLWDPFTGTELTVVGDFAVGVKTIQWKKTRGRQLLVTGCNENLPQVWELVESIKGKDKDKKFELRRYWGAKVDALALSGVGGNHRLIKDIRARLEQRHATSFV
ncbi:hypothetical protein EC991_002093 [Linnemannia zychae]|nr:hypothetical protein EC991_002093 [Linnemannia zychae]